MMFTKMICEEAIFLESGYDPIRSTGEVFVTYPCVFNTLTFRLSATPLLVVLSDIISGGEHSSYDFYITVNDYCRIENCIVAVAWDTDEEILIELDEEERENLYRRLDELCRERYGKSCEEMLKTSQPAPNAP